MEAKVDKSGCISCGICESECPEVFPIAQEGVAEAYNNPVPEEYQQGAKDAAADCPVSVIKIQE